MTEEQRREFLDAVDVVCMACVRPSDEDEDWDEDACEKCYVRKSVDAYRADGK